jgi:hypothetical protein
MEEEEEVVVVEGKLHKSIHSSTRTSSVILSILTQSIDSKR